LILDSLSKEIRRLCKSPLAVLGGLLLLLGNNITLLSESLLNILSLGGNGTQMGPWRLGGTRRCCLLVVDRGTGTRRKVCGLTLELGSLRSWLLGVARLLLVGRHLVARHERPS